MISALNALRVLLKVHGVTNSHHKFTRNSTLIYTDTENNYQRLLEYMKSQELLDDTTKRSQFHTYTPQTKRTHGFLLCSLDHKRATEEVQEALLCEYDIEASTVYEMKAIGTLL